MMVRKLCLALASLLACAVSAQAETASADDFAANVRQHVVFVQTASRLAEQQARDEKFRRFARYEVDAQQRAADDLKMWETGRAISSFGSSLVVANTAIDPVSDGRDTIMSGRSVAVDPGPVTEWSRPEPGVAMVSPIMLVMPKLGQLQGDDFDRLYRATLAVSLKELAGFYEAYSLTGKDVALRAMAQRELPLVRQRLAALEAL